MNPQISVVVEWDNVHLSSSGMLAERSLRCLAAELSAIEETFEVIILFDEHDRDDVARLAARVFASLEPTLVGLRDRRYYEMKNAGLSIARGDLVVLWDSDIEPVRGALRTLVDAFDDPARQIVAGCPFIDPSTFAGRTWSVLSVFPPRSPDDRIERVPRFFANLVAFRRHIVERYRFVDDSRMRMQCVELSARLTAAGIAIWCARGAQVKHPPPATMGGLVQRALWHAHDIVESHAQRGRAIAGMRALASIAAAAGRRIRKLGRQRAALGIPLYESPAIALAIVGFGILELLFLPVAVVLPHMPRWAT